MSPVFGFEKWCNLSSNGIYSSINNGLVDQQILLSHREVCLGEAIALFDPRKEKYISSTVIEYVHAKRTRDILLKRFTDSDKMNVLMIEGERYVAVKTNIFKYTMRKNGNDMTLAEFCIWYDKVDRKEASKVITNYGDNAIPGSSIKCAVSEAFLPELIILDDNDVMKIRKKRKILTYPMFHKTKNDELYSKLMLYHPFLRIDELDFID